MRGVSQQKKRRYMPKMKYVMLWWGKVKYFFPQRQTIHDAVVLLMFLINYGNNSFNRQTTSLNRRGI